MTAGSMPEAEIKELVRGLDPPDWVQIDLIAGMPPERRTIPGLHAQEFAMAVVRGDLRRRFPYLSLAQLNLMTLKHFTPVRMPDEWPPK